MAMDEITKGLLNIGYDADEMRSQASRVFLVLKSLGLICTICFSPAAFTQNRYQITRIPTAQGANSTALGTNNKGEVVGYSFQGEDYKAFLYSFSDPDKLAENLSEAGFNSLDVAYGINDKGWIVGYGTTSDNLTAAFVAVPEGRGNQGQAVQPQPQSQHRGQGQQVSESNEEDYDVFYTRLSSEEGSWVEAGNYAYCFRPRVSGDWRPYRDGHWVWTESRLVLGLKRPFCLGNLPLRPMGQYWWDRMVLGPRASMGASLGLLEGK